MRQISPSLPVFAPYAVGDEEPASWELFHEQSKLRGFDADVLKLAAGDRILGAAIDRFRIPPSGPSHELARRARQISNGIRVALPSGQSRLDGRTFLSVVEGRASAREFPEDPIALEGGELVVKIWIAMRRASPAAHTSNLSRKEA